MTEHELRMLSGMFHPDMCPRDLSNAGLSLIEELEKVLSELEQLREQNLRFTAALEHIQAIAGHPDASEGCRQIIKRADEVLNG